MRDIFAACCVAVLVGVATFFFVATVI